MNDVLNTFAQVKNCPSGSPDANDCLTNIPTVSATPSAVSTVLGITFGVLAAVAVLIIVIQGVKFALSSGDPQKAADARKGIIYAAVGLVIALSAEAVVSLILRKI